MLGLFPWSLLLSAVVLILIKILAKNWVLLEKVAHTERHSAFLIETLCIYSEDTAV